MSERWCIVGDQRCGSHWLLSMLPDRCTPLNEFINYEVYLNHIDITLDDNNYLRITHDKSSTKLEFKDFIELREYQIKHVNRNQKIKIILFCNSRHLPHGSFIRTLKDAGFRFIFLERNLLDRALSNIVLKHTKIAHRWNNNIPLPPPESLEEITVEIKDWMKQLFICHQSKLCRGYLFKSYEYTSVRYENLIHDCRNHFIPVNDKGHISKTWSVDYKKIISNYDQLKEVYDGFIKNIDKNNYIAGQIFNG